MTGQGYRGFSVRNTLLTAVDTEPLPPLFEDLLADIKRSAETPFRGLTSDGLPKPELFGLERVASTAPIRHAAEHYLESLGDLSRHVMFPLSSEQWQMWENTGVKLRKPGIFIRDLTTDQRTAALNVIQASLSPEGFDLVRDVMRVNSYLYEVTAHPHYLEGEWLYRLSIFGQPSRDDPWGWQMDGHHNNLNCLVLGDQIVFSPRLLGAEPVSVDSGPHTGLRLFQRHQEAGLALLRSLSKEQLAKARVVPSILRDDCPPERWHGLDQVQVGGAGADNKIVPYEGITVEELGSSGSLLFELIELYVGELPSPHFEHKMREVKRHSGDLHFVWLGGFGEDDPFAYRVQSPVIYIEFTHQAGANLEIYDPSRMHVHTVVRTPNGNDYGKALIDQWYARSKAASSGGFAI